MSACHSAAVSAIGIIIYRPIPDFETVAVFHHRLNQCRQRVSQAFLTAVFNNDVFLNRHFVFVLFEIMAFKNIVKLPKTFKFIADGYPAYPLAAQRFALNKDNPLNFDITQVIGLTNDDAVSKEFRPFKQMIERLNRTFKASYRCTCGYDNFDGSNYAVALWVCYYNFLRPHKFNSYRILNKVDMLESADTMPGKWQLLIYLGQKTVANIQSWQANA